MTFRLQLRWRRIKARTYDLPWRGVLAVSPGGAAWTGFVGGGETMALRWSADGLTFETRNSPRERWPVLDGGAASERGELRLGNQLTWAGWVISVESVPALDAATRARFDLARTDDAALVVLADELESAGQLLEAGYARALLDPAQLELQRKLLHRAPASFRALISRGPVERCTAGCDVRWEALPLGETPWTRRCTRCEKDVQWCTEPDARPEGEAPLAIDPAAERTPGDLPPIYTDPIY